MTETHAHTGAPATHAVGDNGTGGQPVAPMMSAPAAMPMDARTLKARIFSADRKRFKSEIVMFFGEQIEIRQPTLSRMLANAEEMQDGVQQRGTFVLMNYAYVPGTDLRVFDVSDEEQILSLPYGDDFARVMAAFQKVTGINVDAATKNSEASPSASK